MLHRRELRGVHVGYFGGGEVRGVDAAPPRVRVLHHFLQIWVGLIRDDTHHHLRRTAGGRGILARAVLDCARAVADAVLPHVGGVDPRETEDAGGAWDGEALRGVPVRSGDVPGEEGSLHRHQPVRPVRPAIGGPDHLRRPGHRSGFRRDADHGVHGGYLFHFPQNFLLGVSVHHPLVCFLDLHRIGAGVLLHRHRRMRPRRSPFRLHLLHHHNGDRGIPRELLRGRAIPELPLHVEIPAGPHLHHSDRVPLVFRRPHHHHAVECKVRNTRQAVLPAGERGLREPGGDPAIDPDVVDLRQDRPPRHGIGGVRVYRWNRQLLRHGQQSFGIRRDQVVGDGHCGEQL
mmetsp:Transcript_37610/g.80240  ORF Transcript_37610/g.80240 Transcript_37610/m.80240 type:complete len:345 (-) Transcript_37610:601-1635(-)